MTNQPSRNVSANPEIRLFHAIPVAPVGSAIAPSASYGAEIPPGVRSQLGWNETDRKPLTFATDHITKALAFALDKTTDHLLFNTPVPGTPYELVVTGDRNSVMSRQREGVVFSFPKGNFVELPNAPRQFVSSDPVPFSETQKAMEIKDTISLLNGGLQIFTLAETRQELDRQHFLKKHIFTGNMNETESIYKNMGRLIKEGRLVWENQARGINPSPELAVMLKLDAPVFAHPPKASSVPAPILSPAV